MKPTVPEVMPLVQQLYDSPGGGAGCCLHIVLDDGNVEDHSVDFCIENAEPDHPMCIEVARLLRLMSKTQRRKLGMGAKR